jgi:polyisoprenoid-binding protein YceI
MIRRALSILTIAALAAFPAHADTFVIDKTHSEAGFQIRHLFSNVRGRFQAFEGTITMDAAKPQASSVQFKIDAASIDTDNDKRDEHLRSSDFFDVANHPEITFTSESVRATGKDRYEVIGTLAMRGVAKKIVLPVAYLGAGKDPWGNVRAGFSTIVTLNRKDFGISWNKALDSGGFLLGDDVIVTVDLESVKQQDQSPS